MTKISKILSIIILISVLYLILYNVNASDIWEIGRDFLETGASTTGMTQEDVRIFEGLINTKAGFEELIDFLWGLGLLTIFISTVVLGIKYMLVLPNEKSRLKQSTTPYIIGVVIIFGALTIWKFIIILLDGSL